MTTARGLDAPRYVPEAQVLGPPLIYSAPCPGCGQMVPWVSVPWSSGSSGARCEYEIRCAC